MDKVRFEVPPVGVKFLDSLQGFEGVPVYEGVSYCDAVQRATSGEELLVVPGSIDVCGWSVVVLGLKAPESDFEKSLEPRVKTPTAGVYLAPMSRFAEALEPDVVIVRGSPVMLRRLADRMGEGALQSTYRDRMEWTALGAGEGGLNLRVMLIYAVNYTLSLLNRLKLFRDLTMWLFQKEFVTKLFEKMIKNALADMSMCRNSTVIPYLENAGNISFFCTGGVTWGGNSPRYMTSGFPYHLIRPLL